MEGPEAAVLGPVGGPELQARKQESTQTVGSGTQIQQVVYQVLGPEYAGPT